jgi:acetyl-CoA acetyltransferase
MQFTQKRMTSLFLLILFGATAAFAQPAKKSAVSDEEVKMFAAAFQQVQAINQQAQQKMAMAVQEEDLAVERYNEIQTAQQDPNKTVDATKEELAKHKAALQSLKEIQATTQQQMQSEITESGLTITRYQQIMQALQTNKDLQQKVQAEMQQG